MAPSGYPTAETPLPFLMAKKSRKKKNKSKRDSQKAAPEAPKATAEPPAAAPLGTGRVLKKKVPPVSPKEKAALAKKAARANWAERMTSEGR